MKKLAFISVITAAVIAAAVSCHKSGDIADEVIYMQEETLSPLTVTGCIGGADTKVTYTIDSDNKKISQKWAVGDTIIGIDNASTPKTYTYVVTKVSNDTASFNLVKGDSRYGTATDNPSYGTTMYMIYAPGYAAKDFSSGGSLSIDISKQDTTNVGNSASGLHIPGIMTATGTVNIDNKLELTFANRLELLMIEKPTLSGRTTETTITSFTVSGSESLPTTATFSASGFKVGSDKGTVTKNCSLKTTASGTTSGTVLIALMPASQQNLIIKSSNSYTDTVKSHTPTASKLLKLSGAAFNPPAVTGVSITTDPPTIDVGSTVQLSYSVTPSDAGYTAKWTSSATGVATVNETTGVVTGVSAGDATITITVTDTYHDNKTFSATCTVKVNKSVFLPGKFSVGATKTVKFTNGNLYWGGSAFKLEEKQTDYPLSWDDSHVSHFFWSKTASVAYAQEYSDSDASTSDTFFFGEGNELSVDGQSGLYALSQDEWTYLISKRTNASSLCKCGVTVTNGGTNYTNCLIIAPDNYDYNTTPLASSYTLDQVNASGLVCLPALGDRKNADLRYIGEDGRYWASTPYVYYSGNATRLFFDSSKVSTYTCTRAFALPVRLVSTASE